MSIVIIVVMFFLAMVGKGKGVVNYKFTIEKIVLTLVITPPLANFVKGHLVAFVPEMVAAISAYVIGLVIVFIIVGFLLIRISKVPEYEDTSGDRAMGFVAGLIKGYTLMALLIFIYANAFVDTVAPTMITQQMKGNFINSQIKNSIEYYRSSIYSVYKRAKSSDVGNLSNSSGQYSDTSISGYNSWIGDTIVSPEPEVKEEDTKK